MSAPAQMTAQTPDTALVLRNDIGAITTLTLNRPRARNALSADLMSALQTELDSINSNTAIKVVILEGSGPAFCAGHDLKEMRAHPDRDYYKTLFEQCSKLMVTLTTLRQPVIAKIHGVATAAGCQLVATCDLAVASEAARFATPGVNIGLFCSTPMVALSRAVGRKAAMEMLLTGDLIDAETAKSIGLVNRVVPADDLDNAAMALATQIAAKSGHVVAIGKEAFYRQIEVSLAEAYAYTSEVMTTNMMARDAAEGIDAFIAKREPRWQEG